jgi:hypothetical protein
MDSSTAIAAVLTRRTVLSDWATKNLLVMQM